MKTILLLVNKHLIEKESRLMEFVRFGIVGIIATGLHYGIYLLLLSSLSTFIAYTIGYVISFGANFFLSTYFTFKTRPNLKRGIGFGVSHLINYALQILLLNFFMWLGITQQLAPIAVFVMVIPVNFLLVRTALKTKYL